MQGSLNAVVDDWRQVLDLHVAACCQPKAQVVQYLVVKKAGRYIDLIKVNGACDKDLDADYALAFALQETQDAVGVLHSGVP